MDLEAALKSKGEVGILRPREPCYLSGLGPASSSLGFSQVKEAVSSHLNITVWRSPFWPSQLGIHILKQTHRAGVVSPEEMQGWWCHSGQPSEGDVSWWGTSPLPFKLYPARELPRSLTTLHLSAECQRPYNIFNASKLFIRSFTWVKIYCCRCRILPVYTCCLLYFKLKLLEKRR